MNMRRVLAIPTAFLGLLCIGPIIVGCGGDNASSTTGTTRAYTATVTLSGGQTGALAISADGSGAATGTLTVNNAAARAVTRAVVATVNLSGTVSSAGAVSLTGHYADSQGATQNVSVTGSVAGLTGGGSGGNLALGIFGQTFNSTWTFTATVNPGTGTGNGASATISFSNPSGANATTSDLTVNLIGGAATNLPGLGKSLAVTATVGNSYARYASFGVTGDYTVGQSYTLDDDKYSVTYGEGGLAGKQWHATGGTVKITAATSSKVTFVITNAMMRPVFGGATGTFTMNFSGETTALVSQ